MFMESCIGVQGLRLDPSSVTGFAALCYEDEGKAC